MYVKKFVLTSTEENYLMKVIKTHRWMIVKVGGEKLDIKFLWLQEKINLAYQEMIDKIRRVENEYRMRRNVHKSN